ncbi:hypothetical protein [Streptomyces sp. NPDC056987]|uniref:hypothetical protein n=1 Tax=Streptomyces sp. NPDC056987 TaxID=3345988 RepID=UPI003643D51A
MAEALSILGAGRPWMLGCADACVPRTAVPTLEKVIGARKAVFGVPERAGDAASAQTEPTA